MAEPDRVEPPRFGDEEKEHKLFTVVLGLGSNVGDRVRNLERALEALRREIRIERISSIYETEPVGVKDQPWFLNLVCVGATRLKPKSLLKLSQETEAGLGRQRGRRHGPRTVDIDILAHDELVIDEPELKVPHPGLAERAFVLEPLVEIAPGWRHPVSKKTAGELLEGLPAQAVRRYSGPPPLHGGAPAL